jgi:hypothetical protein
MDQILKNNKPEVAEFLHLWKNRFERSYDLSDINEQADFYEGISCLARFIAKNSKNGSLKCSPCSLGIEALSVEAEPKA